MESKLVTIRVGQLRAAWLEVERHILFHDFKNPDYVLRFVVTDGAITELAIAEEDLEEGTTTVL